MESPRRNYCYTIIRDDAIYVCGEPAYDSGRKLYVASVVVDGTLCRGESSINYEDAVMCLLTKVNGKGIGIAHC